MDSWHWFLGLLFLVFISFFSIGYFNGQRITPYTTTIEVNDLRRSELGQKSKVYKQPKKIYEPSIARFDCFNDDECKKLAEAIYFEAGIDAFIGKIAVGYVVLKRVSMKSYPNTIEGVLYNLCHFTYTCNGDLDKGIEYNSKQWIDSIYAAELVYLRLVPDPTHGADHYYNPEKVKHIPRWSIVYPKVASVGLYHHFHQRNH